MKTPHSKLLPYLEKYGLTYEQFLKKGRPARGSEWIREARVSIVTELHLTGATWKEMSEITGLGFSAPQNLSRAKGCEAARKNCSENGARTGRTWKGKKRPGQLEAQWKAGNFDHLVGAKIDEDRRKKLRDSFTPERKAKDRERIVAQWRDPEYRDRLLAFHRSPEERCRRSEMQTLRMKLGGARYTYGKGAFVESSKSSRARFFVRSSYERAAVRVLDSDLTVVRFEYERRVRLPTGRWILIDFVVDRADGTREAIEVKASWVLSHPSQEVERERLELARKVADGNGWGFSVWTEKELGDALRNVSA